MSGIFYVSTQNSIIRSWNAVFVDGFFILQVEIGLVIGTTLPDASNTFIGKMTMNMFNLLFICNIS
jgi:hypothetical protein